MLGYRVASSGIQVFLLKLVLPGTWVGVAMDKVLIRFDFVTRAVGHLRKHVFSGGVTRYNGLVLPWAWVFVVAELWKLQFRIYGKSFFLFTVS